MFLTPFTWTKNLVRIWVEPSSWPGFIQTKMVDKGLSGMTARRRLCWQFGGYTLSLIRRLLILAALIICLKLSMPLCPTAFTKFMSRMASMISHQQDTLRLLARLSRTSVPYLALEGSKQCSWHSQMLFCTIPIVELNMWTQTGFQPHSLCHI